ncbi:hypothetical protein EPN90_00050 [Patescibacteria group bacterium]|nr:MAG: hypothetical protein EPN90_00050 [Patescibacteria group bacterium]
MQLFEKKSLGYFLAFAAAAFFVLTLAGLSVKFVDENFPSWRPGVYAVFLSNGQVYFGRIKKENNFALTLGDIYYLKLPKPLASQEELQAQDDVSLIKLGNELHGPEDRMEISRNQILFVEKLKADSRVTKAILQYKQAK